MTAPARKRPSRRNTSLGVIGSALLVTAAIAYSILVPRPWTQEGPSMSPWLEDGDRFVSLHGTPALGDVVVLESPLDHVTTVKRVVGVAGDRIAFVDGALVRNGHVVTGAARRISAHGDQPARACRREHLGAHVYDVVSDADGFPQTQDPVRVAAHHVYVLGDHRDRSHDSRFFGTVDVARVLGRVAWVWWPAPRSTRCPP